MREGARRATHPGVTATGAQIAAAQSAGKAAQAWHALRDSGDLQFAPVTLDKPPQLPSWLQKLGEWLREALGPIGEALGMSWPIVRIVLMVLAALLFLLVLWIALRPVLARVLARRNASQEQDWAPDRDAALDLLEDADRLAGDGRFDEAVHLLLRRSVGQIAQARPEWLHPASTAREIAGIEALPNRARDAFAVIAARVERSLFALRSLDAADWQAARAAYADFALAGVAG